jgi:superfamily II DNA or RNA helicase/intein/homing endonuclease
VTAIIRYQNSCKVTEEDDEEVLGLLDNELSFKLIGSEFSKAYKGYTNDLGEFVSWDGKRHLLSQSGKFPAGLLQRVMDFYAAKGIYPTIIDERPSFEKPTPIDISKRLQILGKEPRPYQVDAANVACATDRGIIRMATGAGKCSSVDSLHITEYGLLDYSELLDLYDIKLKDQEFYQSDCIVSTPLRTSRLDQSSGIYKDGYGDSFTIKTSFNFELTATSDHKIQVLNKDGNLSWKKFYNLEINDFAVISTNNQLFGTIDIPEDEAYWYGLLVGDGSFRRNGTITLTNKDDHILNFALKYCKDNNLNPKIHDSRSLAKDIYVHSKKYRKKLLDLGFEICYSTEKTIPKHIRMANKKSLSAFIRGLYETDGWVEDTPIVCIALSSKKLIEQLHLLLLNFGILASKRVKKTTHHDSYQLTIYREYIPKFIQEIGLDVNGYKYKKLDVAMKNVSKENSNVYLVPNQNHKIRRILDLLKKECAISKIPNYLSIKSWAGIHAWRTPTKNRLRDFLNWVYSNSKNSEAKSLADEIFVLLSGDFFFDRIKHKEKSYSDNYDFVVPDSHSFVSQGFVNHNTLCAALIVAKIGKSATILVIGKDLLYQLQDFFSKIFDEPIGIVGDGLCDIKDINIATIWSVGQALGLSGKLTLDDEDESERKIDPNKFSKIKGMLLNSKTIILDECHLASCFTVQTIARNIKSEYVYGMSASPWRDDGADMLIEAFLGRKIVDVSARALIKQGYLVQPNIRFLAPKPYPFKSGKYPSIYSKYVVNNEQRNGMVLKATTSMVEQGFVPLVLFHTIKHGDILFEQLNRQMSVGLLSGKDSAKQRNKIKDDLESSKIKCLVASKIFDIGIDIPILSGLVIAGAGKSSVRALQRIGRVIRPFKGKSMSAIVDFSDQAPYLFQHAEIRREIYESEFDVTWPKTK